MSHFRNVKFSGNVGSDPERKTIGSNEVLSFTVFAQNRRKNKDTDQYENVGENEPVRVSLWRDLAGMDIRKGDLVEVSGSLSVRRYVKNDGTAGLSFDTDFVDEIRVVYRKDDAAAPATSAPAMAGVSNPF